jgi:hypothetical protein
VCVVSDRNSDGSVPRVCQSSTLHSTACVCSNHFVSIEMSNQVTFNWDCGGPWYAHAETDGCFGAAAYVVSNMPVDQYFTDLGNDVHSGAPLATCASANNPCRAAYAAYVGEGGSRNSWDEVAVLLAARGPDAMTRITSPGRSAYTLVRGSNRMTRGGSNRWTTNASATGGQSCLAHRHGSWAAARAQTAAEIDYLLCQPPQRRATPDWMRSFADLNSPAPPPRPPAPPSPPTQPWGGCEGREDEANCDTCWHINQGAWGDCSSICGCNGGLCNFCSN